MTIAKSKTRTESITNVQSAADGIAANAALKEIGALPANRDFFTSRSGGGKEKVSGCGDRNWGQA